MCPHDSKPEPWDRIDRTREESWEEFAARNTDLLCWNPSVLARFYSDDVLQSDASRRGFVRVDKRLLKYPRIGIIISVRCDASWQPTRNR